MSVFCSAAKNLAGYFKNNKKFVSLPKREGKKMHFVRRLPGILLVIMNFFVAWSHQNAAAQTAETFFKAKNFTYIISAGAGGGYDLYGRLTAEFMQKHMPGSTVVVKNMPGAGHLIGANALYASPADGYTLGTFSTGLIYNQLSQSNNVRYDLTKMSWIGKAGTDPRVIIIGSQNPIKDYPGFMAQKTPLNFAASGPGSASYVEMMLLSKSLGLPIRILTGYTGSNDQLAMRRGEIIGTIGSRSSVQQFVENGYGRLIAQIGGSEKDVPQLSDFPMSESARTSIALIKSQGDIARLSAGPPGIPANRLALLIAAYRDAMNDPSLYDRANKLGYSIEPAFGDDVRRIIELALQQSDETIALLKEALNPPK
jgi:tripartite-type tricarboxylate transporter receptor subunit TctC